MRATLTDEEHKAMDAFLVQTFDAVQNGALTRDDFIEHMAYALTALDIGNRAEATSHFKTSLSRRAGLDSAPKRRSAGRAWAGRERSHVRLVAQATHQG